MLIKAEVDWPPVKPPEAYRLVHQAASAPMVDQAIK